MVVGLTLGSWFAGQLTTPSLVAMGTSSLLTAPWAALLVDVPKLVDREVDVGVSVDSCGDPEGAFSPQPLSHKTIAKANRKAPPEECIYQTLLLCVIRPLPLFKFIGKMTLKIEQFLQHSCSQRVISKES
jgi:hypothetical protein